MATILQRDRLGGEHRTLPWEDLVYVFFGMWTLFGLGLDGYYHRYNPELESFWTPWHAVFYTGFIGNAAFASWLTLKRRAASPSLRAAIPRGYELAIVGLGLFAIGGVGDAIWHTVFGVESSIDALLSPTHLILFTGSLLGSTAPIRAAWGDETGRRPDNWSTFLPVAIAIGFTATAVAFFFQYANGFNNWPLTNTFDPDENLDNLRAGYGVLATMSSTVILLGATLLLLRRWQPPFWTFTLIFAIVGFFLSGLDGFEHWWQMFGPLAGGLTADLVTRRAPGRYAILGASVPAVMWSVSTLFIHLNWTVKWPPELWLGQIVMSSLLGWALSVVVFPPAVPLGPSDPIMKQPDTEAVLS